MTALEFILLQIVKVEPGFAWGVTLIHAPRLPRGA